mmetsp:Transcript_1981/g.4532  ORF Transcript_1981/g.4532 Transcript_1981/m.4532 type:complete len:205 (-) Transcript_1981:295-909(-)
MLQPDSVFSDTLVYVRSSLRIPSSHPPLLSTKDTMVQTFSTAPIPSTSVSTLSSPNRNSPIHISTSSRMRASLLSSIPTTPRLSPARRWRNSTGNITHVGRAQNLTTLPRTLQRSRSSIPSRHSAVPSWILPVHQTTSGGTRGNSTLTPTTGFRTLPSAVKPQWKSASVNNQISPVSSTIISTRKSCITVSRSPRNHANTLVIG